jgi:hypothetical protein
MFDKLKDIKISQTAKKDINSAMTGMYLTSTFFKKHLFATVLFVWLCLSLIAVRFDCVTCMETISSLKTKLEITRTETQSERAKYMTATRESAMQHLVDSLNLGLSIQEQPPYTIKYED